MSGVAVVTGGATGIGAACCRALARAGVEVLIHHRSSHDAARALETGVEALAETAGEHGEPVAVLVNNAGMDVGCAPLHRQAQPDHGTVIHVNGGMFGG